MTAFNDEAKLITVRVSIKGSAGPAFIDWQGKLNNAITSSEGFISLEIIRASLSNTTWIITQRFIAPEQAEAWNSSAACVSLMGELNELALRGSIELLPATSGVSQGGVTEVFVTDVPQNHMASFKEWNAKIHLEEAKHQGFKGVYVQSPIESKGKHWITMLQFDTVQNLDKWLESPERVKLLEEAVPWLPSLEAHRVISPYGGWFSSIAKEGVVPPAWKQTMVVLLILFPIVVLEMKYLMPLLTGLNQSLAVFIGNAVSVTLIAYPFTPLAIKALNWWLVPKKRSGEKVSIYGTLLLLAVYGAFIALFWNFL